MSGERARFAALAVAALVVGCVNAHAQGMPGSPRPDPATNAVPLTNDDWIRAEFPDALNGAEVTSCRAQSDVRGCVLRARWNAAGPAAAIVEQIRADYGTAVGISSSFRMDGGYRGIVQFVPQLPTGPWAHHVDWLAHTLRAFEEFFASLQASAARPVRYRWHNLTVRFTRSTPGHTPAMFAQDWTIHYNVAGGINDREDRVRSTLFHELFHSNDQAHGDWSLGALGSIHRAIRARCGANTRCLTPYAPNTLRVRGGTYYAFQPGNDVREYAAELATRYFLEHTGAWRGTPFRCGPAENARAWRLMVDEFFGGVDRTHCP